MDGMNRGSGAVSISDPYRKLLTSRGYFGIDRGNLHVNRTGTIGSRGTPQYSKDPEHTADLQGQNFYHRLNGRWFSQAIECTEGLLLDPHFALAHAGISLSLFQMVDMNYAPWEGAADSIAGATNALAI